MLPLPPTIRSSPSDPINGWQVRADIHFARSAKRAALSCVGRGGPPEEDGADVTLAPVRDEEEGVLEDGADVTLAPVLDEEEGVLEDGADVTLAPVLDEEEGDGEAGVVMTPMPVLDEEFEFGGPCATACSKKYIGVKSPNARINAIAVQDLWLIFYYRPSLESLELKA
ncbi:MAG: hypothetical protein JO297_05915 [Nitrososphaeraceae archaeon]|nr:hypothetical protein [Nitrososphaeraceae archaeon]